MMENVKLWKNLNFLNFWTLWFYSLKKIFFFLENDFFLSIISSNTLFWPFLLKRKRSKILIFWPNLWTKQIFQKFSTFWPKPWTNPLEKFPSFFFVHSLVSIVLKSVFFFFLETHFFFLGYRQTHFPFLFSQKQRGGKFLIFRPKPWSLWKNPIFFFL